MKTIKAEILMIEGSPFPVIKEIYDPLSRRRDGTATPQAPIIIIGNHLDMLTKDNIRLCIIPAINEKIIIELRDVYIFSSEKVCAIIPLVDDGEYFLALKIAMEGKERFVYIFPMPLIINLGSNGRPDISSYCSDKEK
ncbi:DUF4469 domain-containing protein [Bacteroides nordii]|uniref:DUF4469 domain-containing protein n=1 Tax=Bacteroides nordii TaxID=291645 RepID=UPI001F2F6EB1|nr:DUF4469 domain-containing protein [Bacteroides nordii]MCE8464508.1 DUF4469 domain-containing protein [Bacteroides nordii]UYU49873.1 DUF4469 domain-containing protein [Bacteroides nordii]